MKERMNPSVRAASSSSNGIACGMKFLLFYQRGGSAWCGARKRPSWQFVGGNSSLVLIRIDHRSNHLLSGMRDECTVFTRPFSRFRSLSLSLSLLSFPFFIYVSLLLHLLGFFLSLSSFFHLLQLLLLTLSQPRTLLTATILQIFVHRFYAVPARRTGSGKVAVLLKHWWPRWELWVMSLAILCILCNHFVSPIVRS